MSLRLKLLTPMLFFASLLTAVMIFIFVRDYTDFQEQTRQQTVQRVANASDVFHHYFQDTRGFLELISQNQSVADSILADDQSGVLDLITPFTEHTNVSLIGLYTLNGDIFAQTRDPAVFGRPDALQPLIQRIAGTDQVISTIELLDRKVVLLSGARIKALSGPVGVLVIGRYLDDALIQEAITTVGGDLAVSYDNKLVLSSLGAVDSALPAGYQQTPITFDDLTPSARPFSLIVLENNAAEIQAFRLNLLSVSALILVVGVASIIMALVFLNSISNRVSATLGVLRRLTAGDLSARVMPPISRDEIGRLRDNVNTMAEALEGRIAAEQQAQVELRASNIEMRRLLDLVRDLETPAIPVLEGVLVVPLVGYLDGRRATQIQRTVLETVSEQRVRVVIIDVTAVSTIDQETARHIEQLAQMIQLIGARVLITGMNSTIARAIVDLDLKLANIQIAGRLQDGIALILKDSGSHIATRISVATEGR